LSRVDKYNLRAHTLSLKSIIGEKVRRFQNPTYTCVT
jgi:hypothetical protein